MSWTEKNRITLPVTVPALSADLITNTLYAGGAGGVAVYERDQNAWISRISGLPLGMVATVASINNGNNGRLFAGGVGGIAWSNDNGAHWTAANLLNLDAPPFITAIAPSPNVAHDHVLVAATFQQGVLRSEDGGRSWKASTFGLEALDVTGLAWLDQQTLFAATNDGIYRSPNAGKAWRLCAGTEGGAMADVVTLTDGSVFAAVEIGGILRSTDGGETWSRVGDLSPDIAITRLTIDPDHATHLWLGSHLHGIWRSTDSGTTWEQQHNGSVFTLTPFDGTIVAGINDGIIRCDGKPLPIPPLHDLQQVAPCGNDLILVGATSGIVRVSQDAVTPIIKPVAIVAWAIAPNGRWLMCDPSGLHISDDEGRTWHCVITANTPADPVARHITIQSNGFGLAGTQAQLWRTNDFGSTWQPLPSPFGVLPLIALHTINDSATMSDGAMAATFDPRRNVAQIWQSTTVHHADKAKVKWKRGAALETTWPIIHIYPSPLLITLGGVAYIERAEGKWERMRVGDGAGVRQLVGDQAQNLFALTQSGLWQSEDGGETWHAFASDDESLPADQLIDITLQNGRLIALLSRGRIWSHHL